LILDTNAISAFADEDKGLFEVIRSSLLLALPVVVLGEYRYGIASSRNASGYFAWLEEFVGRSRVLDIDEATAHHYASVRVELKRAGTPIPVNDAWIAALARQHNLPVVSRDHHFDLVRNIRRISW